MKKLTLFFILTILLFLQACSETTITVTFLGYNDEVIETHTLTLEELANLTYPEIVEVHGYRFVEWDRTLENIQEDTTIRAIYEVYKPLENLADFLEKIIDGGNYFEEVDVYLNGKLLQTSTYSRDDYQLYLTLLVDSTQAETILYLDKVDEEYRGFQYVNDEWISTTLTSSAYYNVRFTHSQQRMLPRELDESWFTIEDNTFTVKRSASDAFRNVVPMDGFFNVFIMKVLEDALEVTVEVNQGFDVFRYEIKFSQFNEVVIDLDFD